MFAITGLIGSGKSAVSSIIREAGFEVLDADTLAHSLYRENKDLRKKIAETFGNESLTEYGINRPFISKIVFSDPKKLELLESLIYPLLQSEIEKINPPFLEAAVLYKLPELAKRAEQIWIVEASEETRKQRLLQKGMAADDVEKRMQVQGNAQNVVATPRGCHYIEHGYPIPNDKTKDELKANVLRVLKKYIPKEIQTNVSLKNYTTFKIGGNAKFFAEPKNKEEICSLLAWCKKFKIPYMVLGRGSNILFDDEGYNGLVLKCKLESGLSLHALIQQAANKGLGGLERLEGIPGTVGGAIFMNAGAHGQQISDCVKSVTSITTSGEVITRSREECEFSYRSSIFKRMGHEVIVSAEFDFVPMDKETISKNRKEVLAWRSQKQPLKYPNAGSIFKNPSPLATSHFPLPVSAGSLIDSCGLKGFSIGGAQVSELHANFIVNKGNATAKDVKALMERIIQEVKKTHGVDLEPEILFV